jgi:hypothetical protein
MTLSSRDVQKNCSWNACLTLNGTSAVALLTSPKRGFLRQNMFY